MLNFPLFTIARQIEIRIHQNNVQKWNTIQRHLLTLPMYRGHVQRIEKAHFHMEIRPKVGNRWVNDSLIFGIYLLSFALLRVSNKDKRRGKAYSSNDNEIVKVKR